MCSHCAHHVCGTESGLGFSSKRYVDVEDSSGKATGELTCGLSCERWVRISWEENGTGTPGRGSGKWESGAVRQLGGFHKIEHWSGSLKDGQGDDAEKEGGTRWPTTPHTEEKWDQSDQWPSVVFISKHESHESKIRTYAFIQNVVIWKHGLGVTCKHSCGNRNTSSFAAEIKDFQEGKRFLESKQWLQLVRDLLRRLCLVFRLWPVFRDNK